MLFRILKNKDKPKHKVSKIVKKILLLFKPFYVFDAKKITDDKDFFLGKPKTSGTSTQNKAPERVFVFWTGDNEMSENRKQGIQEIIKNIGVDVILVNKDNLKDYVLKDMPLHKSYKYLSDVHKSDYLRCYFMHNYGGGYHDVKQQKNSWKKVFEKFNKDETKLVAGYRETKSGYAIINQFFDECTSEKITKELALHTLYLVGCGTFICKPRTEFTLEWLNEVHRRLDLVYEDLKANPGNIYGDNKGYPLAWTSILGQVFHPLILKYHKNILYDKRIRFSKVKNYR